MRNLLFLICLLIFTSCSHYIVNESGYVRPPKNYKFSYAKAKVNLNDTLIIDTTAIYYLSNSNYYRDNDKYKNSDEYIRFYADGKFKSQGVKTYPDIKDVNNVESGIIGYFKLKGNIVQLQMYTDINAGSDQLEVGLIDENKNLIILHENPRSNLFTGYSETSLKRKLEASNFSPKVYKKIKIPGLTYTKPIW